MKYPLYAIISIVILATVALIFFIYIVIPIRTNKTSTTIKPTTSPALSNSTMINKSHTPAPIPITHPSTHTSAITLTLHSNSFKNNTAIPSLYTCDGDNISPELNWTITNAKEIQSYVLIVDDPDAQRVVGKTFVHWIVLIAPSISNLRAGISGKQPSPPAPDMAKPDTKNIIEIINDSHQAPYYGPCPPADSGTHTYRFTLFAMTEQGKTIQTALPNSPINADQFKKKFKQSIAAEALLTGTYHKKTK